MSLGELIDLFLGAWPLKDILEMNELDRQEAQAFTRPSSGFYPRFRVATRAGIDGWCGEGEHEEPHKDWME